jgi:hypothetical protein
MSKVGREQQVRVRGGGGNWMATNQSTTENLFTIRSSIFESSNTNHIIT